MFCKNLNKWSDNIKHNFYQAIPLNNRAAVGNTNLIVLTFDDNRHTDDEQEPDTDSMDLMTPSSMHKMPHVEMVAPVETAEEKVHKDEITEKPGMNS